MNFKFVHNNINVLDLQKSLRFYEKALGLKETRRIEPETGDFIIVFLGDGISDHLLELTWLKNWNRPYNLGDNEFHLAFETEDYDAAYKKHKDMDCICYENPGMGIYFINDPDGYWLEIIPSKSKPQFKRMNC
ncbi:MAG: lactoylglutathione lyase [Lachnospiraceae bacterium]|jgi:lactoylglutathione lyase|nr:lactoylglutathione lyase [Lachnospiraceae bacterium]